MRKLTTLFLKAMPLLFLVLSFGVKAQLESSITYKIANDVQINSKQLEFDLILLDPDASQNYEEATVQAGILFNTGIVNGGVVTCAIIAGSSQLNSTQVPTSITVVTAQGIIKLASKAPPGCGGGTIISSTTGTRVCRLRLTNTQDWTAGSTANLAHCFTTTPYPSKVSFYQASDCVNTASPVSIANCFSTALNLPLNAPSCVAPLPFAVTGGGNYCSGGVGMPVGLVGSESGVSYTLTPGGAVVPGTGAAITFGNQLAGTYTVSGSKICPDLSVLTTPMTGSAVVTETTSSTVEFTESACDSYFWALSGETYTTSGDKTFVVGCVTNILHLTITPSTTVEFTESACDSYFWALSGETYTTSGDKLFVVGCVTNVLHLTITPSSIVEFTASACESYFWALSGETYTTSGDKTFVVGCVTNILHLTINPAVMATFAPMGPYVQGSVPDALPATSIEGFTGTWAPAAISTAVVGFATYVFTPDAGQCALAGSLTIEVTAIPCPAVATWTGLVNSDWSNPGNWNPDVPCATTAVTIPAGCPNYPILTSGKSTGCITIAYLTLADGSYLIGQQYLCVTNPVVVMRNITNSNYHLISSPVMTTSFGQVFPTPVNDWNFIWAYIYDEPTGFWVNKYYYDNLVPGEGYSVKMTTPNPASFVGALNGVDITRTLSNVNVSGDVNRVGWNLLGNPYPSPIKWDLFGTGAVYVWDQVYGSYRFYNSGLGSLPNGVIPAQNGFFVKTLIHGSTLTIPMAAQVPGIFPLYKESIANVLELQANANGYGDATYIHFNDVATPAFDNQFDAYKLAGLETAPQLYSLASGNDLSINTLPMEGNEVVNLGFTCSVNGTYSINASGVESFDATTPVWLEDLKTGAVQNLRTNPVYTFNYTTADNENHFKLHFKSAYSIPENSLSGINIYSSLRTVVINNTTTLAGEVKIYDLAGRELLNTSMGSQNETRIPVKFAVGTYLVKVITEKGIASNKVFIR